ncbi:MAG: PH domain-containing protein [Anaerolineae bacterium]|uniref:PH domain-containing protein n=1 Tax=Promineifilum sp. TaxID=2664178 RepID=UPI002411C2AC|nr:PH domain-containing protein [Promineifilum sp.]MCO5180707.1 PH domain-containing protein [Promineifilum sp.]MCW5847840.1 PH domain-containing protein [Anaerolineae bacterium]
MTSDSPTDPHAYDHIARFMTEDQDPEQVAKIYEKLSQLLTRGEEPLYIAVQKPMVLDLTPEIVVMTNRRLMHYTPDLFGRAKFTDYIWRDMRSVELEENVWRATLTIEIHDGTQIRVDNLVKEQARRLYAIAQQMEENVREELRLREMEEKRAAAGGVILGGLGSISSATSAAPSEEPLQALSKLKQLMEAGLITADEYEAKKKEILARL